MGFFSSFMSPSQRAIERMDREAREDRAREAKDRAEQRRQDRKWERDHPNGRRRAK